MHGSRHRRSPAPTLCLFGTSGVLVMLPLPAHQKALFAYFPGDSDPDRITRSTATSASIRLKLLTSFGLNLGLMIALGVFVIAQMASMSAHAASVATNS